MVENPMKKCHNGRRHQGGGFLSDIPGKNRVVFDNQLKFLTKKPPVKEGKHRG